jgi:hypothetical protein
MEPQLKPTHSVFSLGIRSKESLFATDSVLLRDELNPEVAQLLLDWAGSTQRGSDLVLQFEVPESASTLTDAQVTRLVRGHFLRMADQQTRKIGDIFLFARVATAVGLLVVIVLLGSAQAIPEDAGKVMGGFRESLTIFAWVAMWKPAELWLYEHWPARHWRRLAMRLANARVTCVPQLAKSNVS